MLKIFVCFVLIVFLSSADTISNFSFKFLIAYFKSYLEDEAVAQVVERWHSVWAGQVRIQGWTLAFFSLELLSIYSHCVLGFF